MKSSDITFASFEDALHTFFTEDPNRCIELGVEKNLDRLPDRSRSADQKFISGCERLLSQSYEIDGDALSADEALDLDLARLMLEFEKHAVSYRFNGRTMMDQCPMAAEDISYGIFSLFAADPRPAQQRLSDILGRMTAIPGYLEGLLKRLDTPVKRWVDIELTALEGLPELFSTVTGWAEEVQWTQADQLKHAVRLAEEAIRNYSAKLAEMPATTQIHMARADAEKLVALKGIDLNFDALHTMAREFLQETNSIIEDLRGKLVEKYGLDERISAKELQRYLHHHLHLHLPIILLIQMGN